MTLTEPAPAVGTAADQASRGTLASVRNAARVLRAFSRAGQELGITELARQLGLSKSTVHRLVTTLTAERLLERGSTPGRYRPVVVQRMPRCIPDKKFDQLFSALPSNLDSRHAA